MSIIQQIHDTQIANADKELHWYITSVIVPELPQLIETLDLCSNLLLYNTPQHPDPTQQILRGPPVKLPLTSNKSEILKGILIRDGPYIVQLSIMLHQSNFNKVIHKLDLIKPVLLHQIITAKKALDSSIDNLQQFIEMNQHGSHLCDLNHNVLIDLFNKLLSNISISKQSLQIPLNPNLVFPNNVIQADFFRPELPSNIAIDLYLNQAEICIDLKKLHIINELPWSKIENGKSYVDNIREEMKLPSIQTTSGAPSTAASTPQLKSEPLKLSDLDSKLKTLRDSNFLNNMLNSLNFKPKLDPVDYITKCVTFNDMVVMVNTKIDVSSPDPILTSVFTKLDSIEYLLSSFLQNLDGISSV
ncbi:RAVE (Rav1p, Rav2p, Skp1p) complex subunit [Yamadazyma tenuis]|uniref:RAVE subunit 2/Rogdi n=1 Tax=Candida tenuis (strain ATCC 10573 / BCRC 21748 / CBS 615 / JCM 9827 / NBRC 10315 / NRRL Y-1498 / VKM Y-70) TaxID=590646 RepID=G3BAH3_CANTC|nr:uncharacterized protein CANTEDRAFT_115515 [Yamadazyma tenuis ATCC 10573]EGV62060.1 hypothetical protein CANTEDRAFT_115515 [Yamadazyma tenuis ATCC 10573]WEJ93309.1 RAVE (Rav1p, Rav2p, Skp1p) complex subunit [Yamadazyma tenuis]